MSKRRFEEEMEFLQLLCTSEYIKWLAAEGYFENEDFRAFLEYLKYFNGENYRVCLLYPQALNVLDTLTSPDIREKLKTDHFYYQLENDLLQMWKERGKTS